LAVVGPLGRVFGDLGGYQHQFGTLKDAFLPPRLSKAPFFSFQYSIHCLRTHGLVIIAGHLYDLEGPKGTRRARLLGASSVVGPGDLLYVVFMFHGLSSHASLSAFPFWF